MPASDLSFDAGMLPGTLRNFSGTSWEPREIGNIFRRVILRVWEAGTGGARPEDRTTVADLTLDAQ